MGGGSLALPSHPPCQHEGVVPDLMAVAKGLTGGYLPLAATLATERVFEAFLGDVEESRTFFHGHTFTGNPLACAAALACIDIFEKDDTLEKLRPVIHGMGNELTDFYQLATVGDIRTCGMMVGIELVRDQESNEPFPVADRVGHRVCMEARNRGAILRPLGDVIILNAPLSLTMDEMKQLVDITRQSIKAVCGS